MSQTDHRFPLAGCGLALGSIVLLLAVLIAWTGSGLLGLSTCENSVKQEVVSPDGLLKIVVFCRDCGATTGFNSQATIIKVNEKLPNDGGTVFITDKDDVTVSWPEANRIVVSMKGGGNDFKKEKSYMGILIDYE